MKNINKFILLSSFALLVLSTTISAAPQFFNAQGANAAAIQGKVDQFRAALGGSNNGVGGSFTTGRREINWDGVPDSFAAPNFFPSNFFNANSPRGAVFGSPTSNVSSDNNNFIVSATQASGTAVRFGNIDASYSNTFQTFSSERLFTVRSTNGLTNTISIQFFVPGTNIPATVSGFGAVFCDVDFNTNTSIRFYGIDGRLLLVASSISAFNNGLSFFSVFFNAGERIARVEIAAGNRPLRAGNVDEVNGVDVIAFDDFIYGEPRAAQYHASDFDGDGVSDAAVFRPSTGNWFILNSGSNTFRIEQFGSNGDIPINGDFDGDSLADLAVFRPAVGEWYFQRSSNGTVFGVPFGQNGDRPVPSDYDKDGKTDIAFWRPSNGNYFVLRSSDNFGTFFGFPFGQNGDLPVGASVTP